MQKSFRLGSTSYVYPADLVTNARRLAGSVDDIELVLFETDNLTNFPTRDTIAELNEIARENALTYTVHLPRDVNLNDEISSDQNRRAVEATRALHAYAYVMHLDGRALMQDTSAANVARWQVQAARALEQVIAWVGDATRVCVENVEAWDPAYFQDMVAELQTSRCIDIGHFWLNQCDPLPHLDAYLSRARVIHLHGVDARDHSALTHQPQRQLVSVLETLLRQNYSGVVTLEVFGESDFLTSVETLERALEKISG